MKRAMWPAPVLPRAPHGRFGDEVQVAFERLPLLTTEPLVDVHSDTVMSISTANSASFVTLDYGGTWCAWDADALKPRVRGKLEGRGRAVHASPDGSQFVALLATKPSDTWYAHDPVVVDVQTSDPEPCDGDLVTSAAWTPDSEAVVLTGVTGYRIHDFDEPASHEGNGYARRLARVHRSPVR